MKTSQRFLSGIAVSLALILPCFWQPRIQAGDLSSHVYNAWLAREAVDGKLEGIRVAYQSTNVLFDLLLSQAVARLGFDAGQKVLMAVLVLTLFWGAFAFVWASAGRKVWSVAPCLAILAYGWTFHMGFCNFYLSTGLSLLYLALTSRVGAKRLAWALPVLGLAASAHILPVAWALFVQTYSHVAAKLEGRKRPVLLGAGLVAILLAHLALGMWFPIRWSVWQFLFVSGADQAWVYGTKYAAVSFGLLFLYCLLFLQRAVVTGLGSLMGNVRFHAVLLTAVAIMVLPNSVQLPQYNHALAFISQRMSLPLAILVCAGLAAECIPKPVVAVFSGLAIIFFSFLYVDSWALNSLESEMEGLLSQMPPGARVVSALADSSSRIDPLLHMVDRACINKCYSYANYEPSTAQFRIRADQSSRVVLSDSGDCRAAGEGNYVVKERDGVLYQVRACRPAGGRLCLGALKPGDVTGKIELRVMSRLY